MEKRLRNLSMLVSEFQPHAWDLIRFACINPSKEVSDEILRKTFTLVFKSIKAGKNFLPLHLFVYSKIIDAVKKNKETPKKHVLGVKDLKNNICIEHFNPSEVTKFDLFDVMHKIGPEERILLCLSIRHKINNNELATLFRTSTGTIMSRLTKARTALAQEIIVASGISMIKLPNKAEKKECFFTKSSSHDSITKHMTKCALCKNFYNWHDKINRSLEAVPRPKVSSSINREIFKHLSHVSIHKSMIFSIRTRWTSRTAFIIFILGMLFLGGVWFKKHKNAQYNPIQAIKISDSLVVAQKNNEVKYFLSTFVPKNAKNWKEMNKKLKEAVANYGEVTETATENSVKYELAIEKDAAIKLVQGIQNNANFEVKTVIDEHPLEKKDTVRVEIQVNKDGI